jgi:hypothetical protein
MNWIARLFSITALIATSACASLTADAPLFTVADAANPSPVLEGVWVEVNDSCPAATIQASGPLPERCMSFELRQTPAGWIIRTPALGVTSLADGAQAEEAEGIIASAVERDLEGLYAPLYVLERVGRDETGGFSIRYDGIIPIGEHPAREVAMMFEISCGQALADGPIDGVTEDFDETGEQVICKAHNRRAVREAVRRAAIENLPYLQNHRLILRRPAAALVADLGPDTSP